MKKKIFLLLVVCFVVNGVSKAQNVFICRHANVSFFSSAPVEDIAAKTSQAVSAINMQTGAIYFKIPIRTFQFRKSLMQEHFNTDYIESDKYPFAEFKGKILNFKRPDGDGKYNVIVDGQLTIHGVTKEYKEPGTLEIKDGKVTAHSTFNIRIADHHVDIPQILFKNIAEVVEVTVNATYEPQKKK